MLEFNLRERPPIADVRERPLTIARIAPVKSTVNGLVLRRLLSRLVARVTEPLPFAACQRRAGLPHHWPRWFTVCQ